MDFIIDTLFQVFFAFFWIFAFMGFWFTEKNKRKSALIFLAFASPLLLTWTVYSYINVLQPRFKDIPYYSTKDYKTTSGQCTKVNSASRGITPSFIIEKETYYYNPWVNKVFKGSSYKLKYLPNSKYVIEVEKIE